MKRFVFSLLWRCNERCLFCAKGTCPPGAKAEFTPSEAIALLAKKRKEGFDELDLDGGEPTLYPQLPRVVKAAMDLGFRSVGILTNGVELADKTKVARLLRAHKDAPRRLSFCVSLHSHRREIAECLSASRGTFDKTVKGIKNLLAARADVSVYHVITSLSSPGLPDFAEFVRSEFKGLRAVEFSHIFPPRGTLSAPAIYPRLSDVPPRFARARKILKGAGIRSLFMNCGTVPWCLMGGFEDLFVESVKKNVDTRTCDSSKDQLLPSLAAIFKRGGKVKSADCRRCSLDFVCGGVWDFYGRLYGTGELSPCGPGFFPPARGSARRAAVSLSAAGEEELLLRILDSRLKGFTRLKFSGWKPGAKKLRAIQAFARGIGVEFVSSQLQPRPRASRSSQRA